MRKINKKNLPSYNGKIYNNIRDNAKENLKNQLMEDQKGLCAYTEAKLDFFTVDEHNDHFNPNLKDKEQDGYHNWFLTLAKTNKFKSDNWNEFQPLYHPSIDSIEDYIKYEKTTGKFEGQGDTKAVNLIELLGLNLPKLVKQRNETIKKLYRIKSNLCPQDFIKECREKYIDSIQFYSAIKAHFSEELPKEQLEELLSLAESYEVEA